MNGFPCVYHLHCGNRSRIQKFGLRVFGSYIFYRSLQLKTKKDLLSHSATNFAILELHYKLCNNEIHSTIKKGLNDYISPPLLCPKFAQDITRDDFNPIFEISIHSSNKTEKTFQS